MKDRNKILHCYCPGSIELVSSLKMGYQVWQELVKKWNYTECEIDELEKEILTLNSLLEKNWIKFRTIISDEKKSYRMSVV